VSVQQRVLDHVGRAPYGLTAGEIYRQVGGHDVKSAIEGLAGTLQCGVQDTRGSSGCLRPLPVWRIGCRLVGAREYLSAAHGAPGLALGPEEDVGLVRRAIHCLAVLQRTARPLTGVELHSLCSGSRVGQDLPVLCRWGLVISSRQSTGTAGRPATYYTLGAP
jgi:hypothetical protein